MMNRLITVLLRIGAAFTLAAKRILAQRGLAAATLLGLIATVAITISIPLYSDAVYQQILQKELTQGSAGEVSQASFPPFSFVFRYTGAWNGALQWEDIQPVDTYLSDQAAQVLRLPVKRLVRYMKTDAFRLFPQASGGYTDNQAPLTWGMFGFMSGFQGHISLVEGGYPQEPGPDNASPIDILVSEALASRLGLQPGEEYIALGDRVTGSKQADVQIPVRISGIWKPSDSQEDYWFIRPETLEDVFIIPEAAYVTRISPLLSGEVYTASWFLQMDGSGVHSSDASALIARIHSIQTRAAVLLPKISLDVSPLDSLFQYQKNASNLTILLYAFSIPILLMLLIFTGLIVQMAVERRRNEMAVLRSRGATLWQVVGIAAVEGLILAGLTLVIATPIGKQVAEFLGRTQSFLNFSAVSGLHAQFSRSIFQIGILVAGLALVAQVIPTIGAAQTTIIAYKQERARQLHQPWWQRLWLDALLFIPAVYGAYLLRQQGSVILPATGSNLPADPFQNPLLFLVPFLSIFAATLFLLRLLPFLMSGLAWLAARTSSVGVLLAARHLSRSPGFYNAPLLLLVLTLSLSTFTASLAQTLDRHLSDQVYYQTGSDIRLLEFGNLEGASPPGRASSGTAAEGTLQVASSQWFFLPVSEHLRISGVRSAARVGNYTASLWVSQDAVTGRYLGIDRTDFPQAAFWRSDFAAESLGALMNALALAPEGVLLPRAFMASQALRPGDSFHITVHTYGVSSEFDARIVGGFDYFPNWYPGDGPLVVGNLDYLFERAGGEYPYEVWLKTKPVASVPEIISGVRQIDKSLMDWKAAQPQVAEDQVQPERQGLFGLLSIGFAAAALLTVLGFLLYAFFSFQRRFIELGVLRAIGLSSGQMMVFLASELAFLLGAGLAAGTGLGVLISNLFIPYLQVGSTATARIPPFLVQINWMSIFQMYILFGLLFIIALTALAVFLLRMKIFQAVKLGEAV